MRQKILGLAAVLGVLAGLLVTVSVAPPAAADHSWYDQVDAQGSNDVPGQKDLTQLGFDFSHTGDNDFWFRWQWDELGTSGNNTMDACGLIDTNGDGNAEYAQCAITNGNPASLTSAVLYSCGNGAPDKCTNPRSTVQSWTGSDPANPCTVTHNSPGTPVLNPFNGNADVRATCVITLNPFPPLTSLTNVCSYPSGVPGSDPSDCVLAPGAGLTIVKDAGSDTTTPFPFTLRTNGGTLIANQTITGSGSGLFIPLDNSNETYRLTEAVPSGWTQTGVTCTNAAGYNATNQTFTLAPTDLRVTCTFTNARIRYADLSVDKADDLDPAVPGAEVTYTIPVTNNGPDDATAVTVSDTLPTGMSAVSASVPGGTCSIAANPVTCSLGTLANGATRTVTIVAQVSPTLSGLPRTLTDTVTVATTSVDQVSDNDQASEDTEVVEPITVGKAADATTAPESGAPVEFTFTVANNGPEDATLQSLVDSVFGDLDGRGDCAVPATITAGGTYTCRLTEVIGGDAGDVHENEVTAQVLDAYGEVRTRTSPPVEIDITDDPPAAVVLKGALPGSVPETGGDVTYTVGVTNTVGEPIELTTLVDDRFGDLDGLGTCALPQTIAVGDDYQCSFTVPLTGNVGDDHVNVITATVRDDEGTEVPVDSNPVTVTFTDVSPELSIVKAADPTSVPETGGEVTFTVDLTNDGAEAFEVTTLDDSVFGDLDGLGTCALPIAVPAGATRSCAFTRNLVGDAGDEHRNTINGTAVDDEGTQTPATSNEAVVTFTDVPAELTVRKVPSPTAVPESGGDVLFTFEVENTSAGDAVTVESVVDDVLGDLGGDCTPALPTTLAPGETLTCSRLEWLAGDAGVDHENTVTVTGTDDDDQPVTAEDTATVAFDDVAPEATVVKSADPTAVPESGGDVDFGVAVTNDGTEPLDLTALVDDVFGDLDGRGTCALPQVVAPGDTYTCTFVERLAGQPATPHVDVVTATLADDEGNEIRPDSNEVQVDFLDEASALAVVKSADRAEALATGEDVDFSAVVTNTSTADAVTVTSVVDDVYGDVSGACAPALPAVLAPGDSLTCEWTGTVSGPFGGTHVNTVTAAGTDDDGTPVEADDDLTLPLSDGDATLAVVKAADRASVPETGGAVTFTAVVENTSLFDDVTVTSVVDDQFGDVSGSCAPALPVTLAPDETLTCAFTRTIAGQAGGVHLDVVDVTGTGDDGDDVAATSNEVEVGFDDVVPEVVVTKAASPTSVPETGGDVSFSVVVANEGDEAVTVSALVDSVFGDLDGDGTCVLPQTIAAGDSYGCAFTERLVGNAGTTHVDTITATAGDDDGNEVTPESNPAEVDFTDVPPEASVGKDASVGSVPESGGDVTFTASVTNEGDEAFTVTGLVDDAFGDLDGRGTCVLPQVLAPAESYACEFTERLVGQAGGVHRNTITATVRDDDGDPVPFDSPEVEVGFDDVASSLSVTKTADRAVVVPGDEVEFTAVVENTSSYDTVTVTTLDDDVFGDVAAGCLPALPADLAPGGALVCTFTGTVDGPLGSTHTNVVTAGGVDDDGGPVVADDDLDLPLDDGPGALTVTKTADAATAPETGGDVTYVVDVENTSPLDSVTVEALVDDRFGDVADGCDPALPVTLAPGEVLTCEFTRTIAGNAGGSHVNVVTASGTDDDDEAVSAFDDATVVFTDVPPEGVVGKGADVTSVPETGGDVTFTASVTNEGDEAFTVTALVDDVFGDLDGRGDCAVPVALAPDETYECSFVERLVGNTGSRHENRITATVVDDDDTPRTPQSPPVEVGFDDVAPEASVVKSAAPTSVPETGGDVTFTATVTNDGDEAVTVSGLSDSDFGDVTALDTTCSFPQALPVGGDYTCTFTVRLAGNAGTEHVDTVTATVGDDDGNEVTPTSNEARVGFTDVPPDATTGKEADRSSVPETGGDVTFTASVENLGDEPFTVTALVDDVFGNLNGRGDCVLPQVLAPEGRYDCQFTETLVGQAGGVHRNTITATVQDDDGDPVPFDSPEVEVGFDDVAPEASVVKSAAPTSVPETGGDVTFTATVTNDGDEAVTVSGLSDSDFGDVTALDTTCSFPQALPVGGDYTCTFTVRLAGNAGTEHVDTVTATVGDDDGNEVTPTSNEARVGFTDVLPQVEVGKSASVASVPEPGGDVTFTVTVTNPGDEDVVLTTLVDDVFGDLDGRGSCVTGGVIAAGDTFTCSFTERVEGNAGALHTDVVTATVADDEDNVVDGDSPPVDVEVTDVASSLSVTKTPSVDEVVETGGPVTFTVRVENTSPVDTVTLTGVEDDLLGDLTGTCDPDLPVDLAPGEWVTCEVTEELVGDAGELHVNTVTATGTDDDGNDLSMSDKATVAFTDDVPDLVVTKTPSSTAVVEPGGDVTFTVEVVNPSPVDTVTLDAVDDDVYGELTGECGLPLAIAPGDTARCEFTRAVTGNAGDQHRNTVTVAGTDDDGSPVGGAASAEVDLLDDEASAIEVDKSASTATVDAPGGDVTYDVTVTNTSPVDTVTIETLVDEFGTETLDLATTCGLPVTLAPDESLTCSFDRRIEGLGGEVDTDVVTATGTDDDGTEVADSDSATVWVDPVVALVVDKDDGDGSIVPGRPFIYEIRVANDGPSTAFEPTTVVDQLPTGLGVASVAGNGWDCSATAGRRVECTHPGPLAADASLPPVRVTVTTSPDLRGRVVNVAVAENPDDPDGGDDRTSTPTAPIADLELTKSADAASVALGDVVEYTLVLRNDGPSTATGITVTEDPGPGLRFVSASPERGRFDEATGTWRLDRLEVGTSTFLVYRARVVGPTGTRNDAWVSAAGEVDPDSSATELPSGGGEDDEAAAAVTVLDTPPPPAPAPDRPLPRTGGDVARLVALGLGLVLGGLLLRRRRPRTA